MSEVTISPAEAIFRMEKDPTPGEVSQLGSVVSLAGRIRNLGQQLLRENQISGVAMVDQPTVYYIGDYKRLALVFTIRLEIDVQEPEE